MHDIMDAGTRRMLINFTILLLIELLLFRVIFILVYIPSGSMEPTLATKSLHLAWRLPYTLGMEADIQRGDIVVFRSDSGPEYIKRAIGLPGDQIEIRDGAVYVNGIQESGSYLQESTYTSEGNASTYTVPEGCIFVMGDNRSGSYDSRYWPQPFVSLGAIEAKLIF